MDGLMQFEATINLFLQSLGGWLELPMKAFSFLGQEEFFLLALPILYWCVDAGLGLRIGMMLMISNGVNGFFKVLFHSPRPYWVDRRVTAYASETSFGIPSGHAEIAAGLWGLLAARLKKTWLTIVCLLVIFFIGFSRLYLGVHFTRDVLFGWALGGLTLLAFLALEKPVLRWVKKSSTAQLIAAAFVTSLVLILLVITPILIITNWQVPSDWLANIQAATPDSPIAPLEISGAFTISGTWFGMLLGAIWMQRNFNGFSTSGSVWKRALRLLPGLVGLILIWWGLDQIFPDSGNMLSYSLRYLRYALVGFWTAGLAPWLFTKIGLAKTSEG